MSSEKALSAHHSVTELHQWIEAVFNGSEGWAPALEQLMSSFSPDFTMITLQGKTLGVDEVDQLFRSNIGARKLTIAIDQCQTLQENDTSVVCRYRETHHGPDGTLVRWSVAMIDFVTGAPRWRFLQETRVA